MNSPGTGLRIASVLFGIFAIGHLLRLINQARVTVGTLMIPMGVSWIPNRCRRSLGLAVASAAPAHSV